jgi:hypothetical protein
MGGCKPFEQGIKCLGVANAARRLSVWSAIRSPALVFGDHLGRFGTDAVDLPGDLGNPVKSGEQVKSAQI